MKKLVCMTCLLLVCLAAPISIWAQRTHHNGRGITFSLAYGFMHQQDQVFGNSIKGQVLNAGVGAYLRDDLVLFLRGSTNEVIHLQRGPVDHEYNQISGFLGTSLQYWFNNRIYIEGGSGIGSVRHGSTSALPPARRVGFSSLFGAGVNLINTGKGLIKLGVEDTFIVLDNKYIHNVGVNIGYQLR